MREDEDYAGNGEQNHPEAKPIQQVHSPTSICARRFHFLETFPPERQNGDPHSSVWRMGQWSCETLAQQVGGL
jgi:hypothetical protein